MIETIPALGIENNEDGTITLEQEWSGNVERVAIHPLHIRHLAERLGLVKDLTAADAELRRDLDRMKRTLLMIRDRAEQLHTNIFNQSQRGHEDLGIEVAQSAALADIADMICAEFQGDYISEPAVSAPEADKVRTPSGQKPDKPRTDPQIALLDLGD